MTALASRGYGERKHLPGHNQNNPLFLTRNGRALKKKLVPLAEEINAIGTRGLTEVEIKTTRKVLLAIITNLAEDDAALENAERKVPSTRELSRRISSAE
ncbi:hypothetical protein G6F50_015220 [Rhizopus delemar]|uniref:MarR family transcriptional regulator n=1 Tax=Rhizopus delemar TaxID=936053 RepID=A0A9P6XZT0_9FUNG|nr:hypothetical protein G6F50_015220 [Rhizopus delemar]